jgi:hypothetical protein
MDLQIRAGGRSRSGPNPKALDALCLDDHDLFTLVITEVESSTVVGRRPSWLRMDDEWRSTGDSNGECLVRTGFDARVSGHAGGSMLEFSSVGFLDDKKPA